MITLDRFQLHWYYSRLRIGCAVTKKKDPTLFNRFGNERNAMEMKNKIIFTVENVYRATAAKWLIMVGKT